MTIIMVMMMMIPYNSSAHGHTADFASMRRGETGWKQIMFMLWCYLDLNLHASFPASSILHALIFLSGPSALPGNSKAGVLVVGGGRGVEPPQVTTLRKFSEHSQNFQVLLLYTPYYVLLIAQCHEWGSPLPHPFLL